MKFLKSKLKENLKTDEQLVAVYKQTGDESSIEILFDRYSHLIFAVSMKYLHDEEESKDAVLELFSRLPNDLKKYEIRNFAFWIHTVTKNYCFHKLEKDGLTPGPSPKERGEIPDAFIEEPGEADLQKFLLDHLEDALQSLTDKQRKCIELFYLQEKSYEEIQQATGHTYNEVKSHIQNGKRNLKIFLERKKNEQRQKHI